MGRLVLIDGVQRAPEDAAVSVYDRGFLYGDSVFETIRTYGGVPFALAEHMERLARSAERVAIDLPLSPGAFGEEITRGVAAAGNPESFARAMVTRGVGPLGLDPSYAASPLRVVLVEPLEPLPAGHYRDGVAVVTVRTERAGDAAPGAKVSNYLGSLLALRKARAAGAHEALIVDAQGHVVEGTTSNLFLIRGGKLVTPPDEAGILLGITRGRLVTCAEQLGIPLRFAHLAAADVARADEAFVSSTLREVVPVVRVDGHVIGSGKPGPVTRALHAAFREEAGLAGRPMPWE